MTTQAKRLTFEEWLHLPETKERYEIVDGVMYTPPGPNVDHQWIQQEVFSLGREFARNSGLGVFMHAPLDLVIQREPLRVRQPDILFLNSQRTGIRRRSDIIGMPFIEASPDIVIEVLSPSNTRKELDAKSGDYKQAGAYQCWVFSPQAETAEIIDLTGVEPRSIAVFGVADVLRSDLLPGFELSLAEVFN